MKAKAKAKKKGIKNQGFWAAARAHKNNHAYA